MKIAVILPRGTHFGPDRATAIDLCAYDFVRFSRYRDETVVIGEAIDRPFDGVRFIGLSRAGKSQSAFADALATAATSERPDLVVVHQHIPSARRIARRLGDRPVLLHRHNNPKTPKGFLGRWLEARKYAPFARIIVISAFCRDRLLDLFPSLQVKTHVVHNGLDLGEWPVTGAKRPEILFVGRAVPEKGVLEAAHAAVSALLDAPAKTPDWRIRFILSGLDGNAAYAAEVIEALRPLGFQAEVLRDLPHAAVRQAFRDAAIALVPSRFEEPFGRTAIEAMAGGAALISSLRGGLKEIAEGVSLEIDPDAPASIAAAITHLIHDEVLRHRLADEGRKRVESAFAIERSAAQLDDIYASVHKGMGA
ncbi:glycosyltransferase family 4 protein [Pleomorphomonas oryzae]|uniref:glycosyltransferase family 4 protein n=1 Tax=Pleomorphomonas oryzae TaxID=261934 RepID=UPI0004272C3E|nr:glycosyltransferase family 4 protein [Pleomorphomonas oryzae]